MPPHFCTMLLQDPLCLLCSCGRPHGAPALAFDVDARLEAAVTHLEHTLEATRRVGRQRHGKWLLGPARRRRHDDNRHSGPLEAGDTRRWDRSMRVFVGIPNGNQYRHPYYLGGCTLVDALPWVTARLRSNLRGKHPISTRRRSWFSSACDTRKVRMERAASPSDAAKVCPAEACLHLLRGRRREGRSLRNRWRVCPQRLRRAAPPVSSRRPLPPCRLCRGRPLRPARLLALLRARRA